MTYRKAMLLTVGTGRDRKDIADMLLDSIRCQNPERVVFAASKKTADETLARVLPSLSYLGSAVTTLVLDDENDVEACTVQIRAALKELARDTSRDAIVVDFTSGTKPMSAAAFFSAMAEAIPTIIYMEGKRDTTGRVIPGTQTPRRVRPVTLFADMARERAVWLFDHHHYPAAIELFEQHLSFSFCPNERQRAQLYLTLARAYAAWDRFNFSDAWHEFEHLKSLRAHLHTLPCAETIERNQQALYQEKDHEYSVWRLADLFNNAQRRAHQAAYDDAVLRLYRAYEYMAQIVLWHECGQIETKRVPFTELPQELQARYHSTAQAGKPLMLGARDAYILLQAKRPTSPLVSLMHQPHGLELSRALSARNDSILAHGFSCVSQHTFDKLFDILITAAEQTWPRDFARARLFTTFPLLETPQGSTP